MTTAKQETSLNTAQIKPRRWVFRSAPSDRGDLSAMASSATMEADPEQTDEKCLMCGGQERLVTLTDGSDQSLDSDGIVVCAVCHRNLRGEPVPAGLLALFREAAKRRRVTADSFRN
jgi:hypothetical protein